MAGDGAVVRGARWALLRAVAVAVAVLVSLALAAAPLDGVATTHANAFPAPVLHVPFDEGTGTSAGDVAGGGYNATLSGGAGWVTRSGGPAIRLDGVDDRVDIAASGLHHEDGLTFAFWVRAQGGPPAPGSVILEAGAIDCSSATFGLYATADGIEFRTRVSGGLSGVLIFDRSSAYKHIDLWDGAWHHVAASIQSYGWKMLTIDGFQLANAHGWVDFAKETFGGIAVGGPVPGAECGRPAFRGDIDDLRLYAQQLDREQIGSLLPPVASTITYSQPDPIYPRWMAQCVDVAVSPPPPGGRVRVELRDLQGTLVATGLSGGTCYGAPPPRGQYRVPLNVQWAGEYMAQAIFEPGLPWTSSQTQPVPLTVLRRPVSLQVFAPNVMPMTPIVLDAVLNYGASDDRGGTVTLVDTTNGGEVALGTAAVTPVPSTQSGSVRFEIAGRPAGDYTFEARFSGTPNLWAPATRATTVDVDDTLGARGPITFGLSPMYWSRDVLDVYAPAQHAQYVELREPGGQWFRQGYHLPVVYPLNTFAATPRDGPVTIQVRWEDGGGRFSEIHEKTLLLDRTAPSVATAPTTVRAATVSASSVPVRVAWSATDATSGVRVHDVQVSRNGGAYRTVYSETTFQAIAQSLASGDSYRYRVRSRDAAGNWSPWVYDRTMRASVLNDTSTAIRYSGTWSRGTATSYLGGSVRYATRSGAKASVTFTARSFAWVASTGPTRGKARVYVNGSLVRTVDLYSPTVRHRQVVFTTTWSTSVTRTVEIRVLGTSGRPRVDLDAIVLVR